MKRNITIIAMLFIACEPVARRDYEMLRSGDIAPNVPVSSDFEVCILKAELCERGNACGGDAVDCTGPFEDCAWDMPEMHELTCRLEYATCVLEAKPGAPDWYLAHCDEVYKTCPTTP